MMMPQDFAILVHSLDKRPPLLFSFWTSVNVMLCYIS